ncbi:MAG: ABC transporter substrate-binding protein [Oscillospiraceae bacterium]|nr:ABC transporter substrate-binding protein [Oscillospiraceae bacterium]
MKKILAIVLTLTFLFSFAACSNNEKAKIPVIGISQYGEHSSLDNCREGFLTGLKNAGLVEGKDFTVDYQNANFDDATATQIAQNFSSKNYDLMCAIATPSATACFAAAEDKDIPVIFTAITDPVAAKLDKGNITGTSDKLPVEAQLQLIKALQPDAKTVGIIYTTSEPNSVSAIAEYKEKAPEYGLTIEEIGITAQAEAVQAAETLISKNVDCFSNLTDNNVVGVLASILEKTDEAGIPVYGSEIEQVKKGCVASAGIDYIKLGIQTGEMAAKILKGEAKASDIKYETISEYETYINNDQLKKFNISLPTDIQEKAIDALAAE